MMMNDGITKPRQMKNPRNEGSNWKILSKWRILHSYVDFNQMVSKYTLNILIMLGNAMMIQPRFDGSETAHESSNFRTGLRLFY